MTDYGCGEESVEMMGGWKKTEIRKPEIEAEVKRWASDGQDQDNDNRGREVAE
jgi:hypothetical protein